MMMHKQKRFSGSGFNRGAAPRKEGKGPIEGSEARAWPQLIHGRKMGALLLGQSRPGNQSQLSLIGHVRPRPWELVTRQHHWTSSWRCSPLQRATDSSDNSERE